MLTLFHGSPCVFDQFVFRAQDNYGTKYGYPIFLTDCEPLAALYSHKPRKDWPCPHHFLYTVEIPDLTADNCLYLDEPVSPSVVQRMAEHFHGTVPQEATITGRAFKAWLEGLTARKGDPDACKFRAINLLALIDVVAIAWHPTGFPSLITYGVTSPRFINIVKIEHIEFAYIRQEDGKKHLTIYDRYEVNPTVPENEDDLLTDFVHHILCVLLCCFLLCSCHKSSDTVCGVPVKGSAWELATDIVKHGDATFIPECLEVYMSQARISGWYNSNFTSTPYREEPYIDGYLPAEIVCECEKFEVKHAELRIIP